MLDQGYIEGRQGLPTNTTAAELMLPSCPADCSACHSFESGIKLWLPNISQPQPNLAVFQLNFAAPAEFDLVFVTNPNSGDQDARLEALHGELR